MPGTVIHPARIQTMVPDTVFFLQGFDRTGPVLFGIPGEQVDITNTRLEGQIGSDGLVLIWNGVAPTIETLSTNTGFNTKRVCGYSGTAVRIGPH